MRAGLALAVAATALLASACGSVVRPDPQPNLTKEYFYSTTVKHDRLPGGPTGADRAANLASMGSPDDLLGSLFSRFPCEENVEPSLDCHVTPAARRAADERVGRSAAIDGRSILVKHADGSLELMTLYVAGKGTDAVLIDATGKTYTGDLADFLDNNDILEPDDIVLTPDRLTSSGEFRLDIVYGKTRVNWLPWKLGGAAVLLVAAGAVVFLRVRSRRRAAVTPDGPPAA